MNDRHCVIPRRFARLLPSEAILQSGLRLLLRSGRWQRLSHSLVPDAWQSLPQADLSRPADVVEEMTIPLPGVAVAVKLERFWSIIRGHWPN
jgi:hypothetical protein